MIARLGGCAAGPTQKPVSDWHDAVVAVRDQSGTVFMGVNDLVREAQLKRAESLENLKESDFQPGLDTESLAAWDRVLDALAPYSAALTTLLSPDLAGGVGAPTHAGERRCCRAGSQVRRTTCGISRTEG